MDLRELGRTLRERRDAIGMPQSELARRIGVSPSYVSIVERAVEREGGAPTQPSLEVLRAWADALHWDTRYLDQLTILAGHKPANAGDKAPMPFGETGSLSFPQPRRIEEEVLVDDLRRLLSEAQASDAQWSAITDILHIVIDRLAESASSSKIPADRWSVASDLLQSYLEWLLYHLSKDQ